MNNRPLCIYHADCVDGFTAAWIVRKRFGEGIVDFIAAGYDDPPPLVDAVDRPVFIVDFSYDREDLALLLQSASSLLILDHHKSAAERLTGFHAPSTMPDWEQWLQRPIELKGGLEPEMGALFDMNRSGAGLAWDFFFPNQARPALVEHVEDYDLWRFRLPGTRELQAAAASHPFDFAAWDQLVFDAEDAKRRMTMFDEGRGILRKMDKMTTDLLRQTKRRMVIGGQSVWAANLPRMMASEAAGRLAEGEPFAATYFDTATLREFSLRSRQGGADVAAIAEGYGGGGHRNAAGFSRPLGWEGDAA